MINLNFWIFGFSKLGALITRKKLPVTTRNNLIMFVNSFHCREKSSCTQVLIFLQEQIPLQRRNSTKTSAAIGSVDQSGSRRSFFMLRTRSPLASISSSHKSRLFINTCILNSKLMRLTSRWESRWIDL